ncbi:MAG: hypothetical protein M1816_001085 [Peltula sp. TS41687]|nr:MAG: hypothetical protein M1816_001085 [Peltula sp. TS41687]
MSSLAPLRSISNFAGDAAADEQHVLHPPRFGPTGRSMSISNATVPPRISSLAGAGAPGSFMADPRARAMSRPTNLHMDRMVDDDDKDGLTAHEQLLAEVKEQLNKELKIKEGSENLLEALNSKKAKQTKEQRFRVESELNSANRKIAQLKFQIEELQQPQEGELSSRSRISALFRGNVLRSTSDTAVTAPVNGDDAADAESPTFTLSEILQSLEAEGMKPDYYVERANNLVELFKRHPTLKYDLAWSDFGFRMQTMLLSASRDVVAAGYRVTRYAITGRRSLQIIRQLNTDYLVILSLVKEGKASVEREQALKFVRAFLDVKDGVEELAPAVVRTIASVADHTEDRLRSICIETLGELLIRDPPLLVAAGGIGPLTDALGDGTYEASEALVAAILYHMDMPRGRKFIRAGHALDVIFAPFTDSLAVHLSEQKLKSHARVIGSVLRTWSGLMILSMYDFRAIRSFVASLQFPQPRTRDIILELLFDILCIKLPSWSSSFLAGRRLTTYGRVANLRSEPSTQAGSFSGDDSTDQQNLADHFLALTLAVLLEAGLQKMLVGLLKEDIEPLLRRKVMLLLGEVLKMASRLLPDAYNVPSQILPDVFAAAADFRTEGRSWASNTIYQLDIVNRTLQRSGPGAIAPPANVSSGPDVHDRSRQSEQSKLRIGIQVDEGQFRGWLIESQVLSSANYIKWRWDILQAIVEGPLLNPKRLDEAIRATKFLNRIFDFYRPFSFRFADIKNTKPNQRYVRVGSALINTLLQTQDGMKFMLENKVFKQLAECLAQLDPMSGQSSASPLFSPSRLVETLSSGYFAFIGTMSKDPKGLAMLQRFKITNMCYRIMTLTERGDLIKVLLENIDFTLDSPFRVMLSQALTGSSKDIRIFSTNLLRRYVTDVTRPSSSSATAQGAADHAQWAAHLLITQLYDPDVEVCQTAVRILEEACNKMECLELVVQCRPALDHLGEIGAPLLLRFLSTSLGYRYLDDLDYITQEMDDWFLGRNETYVTLVEASLSRALKDPDKARQVNVGLAEHGPQGTAPPHFYRELTRTAEGCRLLQEKGHFAEFVNTIREHGMEEDDGEMLLKVKGCLWAVGNVGSMELGASFIEESDVVRTIVEMAEKSMVISLRGTAFFVLGLISSSVHGSEILSEHGWDGPMTTMGELLGRFIPLDLRRLFSMQPWPYAADEAMARSTIFKMQTLIAGEDRINVRVLELVVDLGNTVLTKRAVSELIRIKKKASGLREPRFFRKVMTILEARPYRLPVRRFVIDLFDKSVMRRLVLDEEDAEQEAVQATADVPPTPRAN